MKYKDYTVKMDRQSGVINTKSEPIIEISTPCIICGNEVRISKWETMPKVCEDCKKAVAFAKKRLKEKEEIKNNGGVVLD